VAFLPKNPFWVTARRGPNCAPVRKRSSPKSAFSAEYALLKELLVEARRKIGLTQAALASRLGRPQSFVSKYERGERRLDVIEFLDVAEALKIDPAAFLRTLSRSRG
jgi:ribosome-binding protein aMBF1 (putative translation factor)